MIISRYLLIIFFSSFSILFKNSSRNFNEDILRLVFAFLVFVAFVATSGSVSGSSSSGVVSHIQILSKVFIGNSQLLSY